MNSLRRTFLIFALVGGGPAGMAAEAALPAGGAVDQRAYRLLHPTPDAQLREMTTDRPDANESPCTVGAGRWQLEMNFANEARTRSDGGRATRPTCTDSRG